MLHLAFVVDQLLCALLGRIIMLEGGFMGVRIMGMVLGEEAAFFSWYDPPLNPRSRVVIVELLRRVKAMERGRSERIMWVFFLGILLYLFWLR
ncbi:hypothetical protein GQ457_09G023410 [Hibiscus cannabinus]